MKLKINTTALLDSTQHFLYLRAGYILHKSICLNPGGPRPWEHNLIRVYVLGNIKTSRCCFFTLISISWAIFFQVAQCTKEVCGAGNSLQPPASSPEPLSHHDAALSISPLTLTRLCRLEGPGTYDPPLVISSPHHLPPSSSAAFHHCLLFCFFHSTDCIYTFMFFIYHLYLSLSPTDCRFSRVRTASFLVIIMFPVVSKYVWLMLDIQ